MGDRDVYAEAGEVSCDEAREIARRYNASHFRNYRDCGEEARYSIPVDPRRDDDIRLEAFIRRAEVAFKRLADAERNLQRAVLDLGALEKLRAHKCTPKLVEDLKAMRQGSQEHADFWKATADVSRVLERVALLDELIQLLELCT